MFGWGGDMMNIHTVINQAWNNVKTAKLRAALAVLGIMIGTASVVILVSAGNMAMQAAMSDVESMNTNTMTLNIWHEDSASSQTTALPQKISIHDIAIMQSLFTPKHAWIPFQIEFPPIRYDGVDFKSPALATTSNAQAVFHLSILHGRKLSYLDHEEYHCVVGFELAKQFERLHHHTIVGTQVKMYDRYFTIVGVYQKMQYPLSVGMNINEGIVFPIHLLHQLINNDEVNSVLITIKGIQNLDALQKMIHQYLVENFASMNIQFHDPRELLHHIKEQQRTLMKLLGLIGSISLFVGGIGIMNVMLVSIIQRKREIGLRKALGARSIDIRRLFLVEAVLIAFLGGVMGIMVGLFITKIISVSMGWVYKIYCVPISYGFTVSVLTGIFFGWYPAQQAAKSKPVKSLNSLM